MMRLIRNTVLLTFFSFCLFTVNAKDAEPISNDKTIEIVRILNNAEVYPNPAEDYIYLKIEDIGVSSELKIEVMSIIGTKMHVSHEKVESGLHKINLSNIPTGHYYVLLTLDTNKSLKKFIKK